MWVYRRKNDRERSTGVRLILMNDRGVEVVEVGNADEVEDEDKMGNEVEVVVGGEEGGVGRRRRRVEGGIMGMGYEVGKVRVRVRRSSQMKRTRMRVKTKRI